MKSKVKIKVCGIREPGNLLEVAALNPDYMGFIFYEQSPRYAGALDPEIMHKLPAGIKKTGVFVNASAGFILQSIDRYRLNAIQLHGDETPELCTKLNAATTCEIIKAFGIEPGFDFEGLKDYLPCTDYFLFDTRAEGYGGTGKTFDWQILDQYQLSKPFFLSGGIGGGDEKAINALAHNALFAIDVNSRFELQPGLKDVEKLKLFFNKLN